MRLFMVLAVVIVTAVSCKEDPLVPCQAMLDQRGHTR